MKYMYCPVCSNYLMSSCGEQDCNCGWKQPIDNSEDLEEEYERGYEAALKQIKRNLEHMCKGMWSIEMCYDGSPNNAEDLDRYGGESECYSFLLEELNLDKV